MEPSLCLTWGQYSLQKTKTNKQKSNSSTAKLGIRAGKRGASPCGEKQEAFPELWGKRSDINAGTLLFSPRWGLEFQVRQQPPPKSTGKTPHPAHPAGRSQALEEVSGTRNVWTPAFKLCEKRKELIPPFTEKGGKAEEHPKSSPTSSPRGCWATPPLHKIVLDTNLK